MGLVTMFVDSLKEVCSTPQGIAAEIFGILALIVSIICYQLNTQKKILVAQMIAATMFIFNCFLLGAPAGAWLNVHGIIRALIFSQKGKRKWCGSRITLIILIIAAGLICLFTAETGSVKDIIVSILPFIGTVFTTISLSMTDAAKIRKLTLPSPPCWFIYHLAHTNVGGCLNEIFVFCSIIVGWLRLDRKGDGKKA